MKEKPIFLSDKFVPAQLPEICAPRKSLLTRFDEAAMDGFVFVSAQGGSGTQGAGALQQGAPRDVHRVQVHSLAPPYLTCVLESFSCPAPED